MPRLPKYDPKASMSSIERSTFLAKKRVKQGGKRGEKVQNLDEVIQEVKELRELVDYLISKEAR